MKKAISLFLGIIIFLSCCVGSSIAEEFSFHKGLTFGISKEDAIKFEEETNNSSFSKTDIGSANYGRPGISGMTTFADERVEIYLYFDKEERLSSVVFVQDVEQNRDYYDRVNDALEKKYKKIADINSYVSYPVIGDDAVSLYKSYNFGYNIVKYFGDAKIEEFNQYMVETDDGYYNIENLLWKHPSMPIYGALLSYSYISKDYVDKTMYEQVQQEKKTQQATEEDI